MDELLAEAEGDDVVIRPTRDVVNGKTHWLLTRPNDPSGRYVAKMRIPAVDSANPSRGCTRAATGSSCSRARPDSSSAGASTSSTRARPRSSTR